MHTATGRALGLIGLLLLFGLLGPRGAAAQAQGCTVVWSGMDSNATHIRIYVADTLEDLRTVPTTLQATVPVSQTSIDCATIGLEQGQYVAADLIDAQGVYQSSALSNVVRFQVLGRPGPLQITLTWSTP